MSEKSSDSQHKMAKKIAQLTKVIFQLHSKNEEGEEMGRAMRRGYEKEIDTIVHDASAIIERQKEIIQTQTQTADLATKLRQAKEQGEQERQMARRDFEAYKQQILQKEADLALEKSEMLNKHKADIVALTKRYEDRLAGVVTELKKAQDAQKTIDELKRLHQTEIANHVKEHNTKCNELAKAKILSEERLQDQFAAEKAELIGKYEKLLSENVKRVTGDEKQRMEQLVP
jgi:hypothetical protein